MLHSMKQSVANSEEKVDVSCGEVKQESQHQLSHNTIHPQALVWDPRGLLQHNLMLASQSVFMLCG